jgi:hypothetical protein
MLRRSVLLVVFALVVFVVPVSAVSADPPAQSGIVERFNAPGWNIAPLFDDEVWIFENFDSLADICDPEGPVPATLNNVQAVFLPNGTVVANVDVGVVPIVVVPMVNDPLNPFGDACDNGEAIAWGSANIQSNDNDVFGPSGSRAVVWGERFNGTATDADGNTYKVHYHAKFQYSESQGFRILSEGGSFRLLPN